MHHRRSIPKQKLYWVEGLVLLKLCLWRRAEQLLKKARGGLLALGAPLEIALVSLDLSALYHLEGRWADLEELAADTYRRFCDLSADSEAIAALCLWKDGVEMRTLTDEVISAAKTAIEERMRYGILG